MADTANPRFQTALTFAAAAHISENHARKGTDFPYVGHPIRVAEILDRFGFGDHLVVAAFLHDTIEDTAVTADQIHERFGRRVADLVSAASERDKSLPWRARKEHTLAELRKETDFGVLVLVAADKLDNVRAIADTLRRRGPQTWSLFNAGEACQRWYYRSIAEVLVAKDPASPLFLALDEETRAVFPEDGARNECAEGHER